MKNLIILLLLLVVGIAVGWAIAGLRPDPADAEADVLVSSRTASKADVSSDARPSPSPASPVDVTAVDLEELDGLHALGGGSPALELHQWLLPRPDRGGLDRLARWIGLTDGQQEQLAEILTNIGQRQIDWERSHIPRTELEPTHVRLEWKPMPAEIRDHLLSQLRETFGDALAEKIRLKGNLDHFAHPRDLIAEPEATVELKLQSDPSSGKLKLGIVDVEREDSDWFLIPKDLSTATSNEAKPLRFAHFFDWDRAVAKLEREAPAAPVVPQDYPHAQPVAGQAGFVTSPYSGKQIDVRGIRAGTLVRDPSFPEEEKKFFRVPEPAE